MKNSFLLPTLLFISVSFSTAFAAEKIYIFTTSKDGKIACIYNGFRNYMNPNHQYPDIPYADRDQSCLNAQAFEELLAEFHDSGYAIHVEVDSNPKTFLSAVEDPETVLIIHEGHTYTREAYADPSKMRFDLNGKKFDESTIQEYLKEVGQKKIRPSKKLKMVYSHACYAHQCESFYRRAFSLPESVSWIGANDGVGAMKASDMLSSFKSFYLREFPEVAKRKRCIRITQPSKVKKD